MLASIKTSKENRDRVTQLTNKLNLGTENIIARLAFSYSLGKEQFLDLSKIEDSSGKEYSTKVLFGNHSDVYIALICIHYQLNKTDKDVGRYIKMHVDDGLRLIEKDIVQKDAVTGNDFIINEIEKGISFFQNN